MWKKILFGKITPDMFIISGVSIALFFFFTKGTIEPFSFLAFIFAAIFEVFFRKQKRIPSNLLSITCAIILAISLKLYAIDILAMRSDAMEPLIPKNAKIFYRPSMFKVSVGDLVIYKPESNQKSYAGKIVKIIDDNFYEITRLNTNEAINISKQEIKGKVVYIAKPR